MPVAVLRRRRALCAAAGAGVLAGAAPALAGPQISTALQGGVAGESQAGTTWHHTNFYGALRADVLFGRDGGREFGVGPFARLATSGFQDFRVAGGVSVLLPIHTDFPVVGSVGGYARSDEPTWQGGFAAELFWGLRSYNYHSSYGWSAGIFAGIDYDLTSDSEHTFVLGAVVDNALVALPLVILLNWFRESSN